MHFELSKSATCFCALFQSLKWIKKVTFQNCDFISQSRHNIFTKQQNPLLKVIFDYFWSNCPYLWFAFNHLKYWVGAQGPVVMAWDSKSLGHGFKSQHHVLDGHFFALICCKNCIDVCLKKTKNKQKRCRGCPICKIRVFTKSISVSSM